MPAISTAAATAPAPAQANSAAPTLATISPLGLPCWASGDASPVGVVAPSAWAAGDPRAGADERAAFELLSEPNPLQARAFELIGVSPGSM